MATAVPQPLEQAIQNASNRFGVPQDLLEGIWRVESGSSFPNPYANGLGYGGEFGTKITAPFGSASDVRRVAEPPVQQQANTSASILANLLRSKGGNVAEALSAYSGGGYTQVPGEVTFGNIQTGALAAGLNPGQNTQFSSGVAQPASFVSGSGGLLGGLESGLNLTGGGLLGGTLGGVEKIVLRGLEIAFGVGLVALGVAGIFIALNKSSGGNAVSTLAGVAVGAGGLPKRRSEAKAAAAEKADRAESERIVREHRTNTEAERARAAKARADTARARATRERRKTRAGQPAQVRKRVEAQRRDERARGVDVFGAPLEEAA